MRKKNKNVKRKPNHHPRHLLGLLELVRKVVIFVLGVSVLLLGVVLIFTPGPSIVVIPVGLAILATEFIWARRILKQFKHKAKELLS